jgi:LCP family protein required for cell wall assembly
LSITITQNQDIPRKRGQPPLWLRASISLFLVIFLFGGLYCGYLFYATIREIVAQAELPAIPVIQLPSIGLPEAVAEEQSEGAGPVPQLPQATSAAMAGSDAAKDIQIAPALPPVPKADEGRINVLLLGIDRRGKTGWGYRTDTIIIVTVDPINKTAGMLSIPRDLHLEIPGVMEDRINAANVYGYTNKYPGGGPALLKRTIEKNFGIPIDYYIMADFQGFEKIIDTLGGIDVNVPHRIHDTQYPDPQPGDPHGMKTVHFDPGPKHLDGQSALEYARSRMSTSDFDRAQRQQQILLAIRAKALNLDLIPKLPSLFTTMGNMIRTDMTLNEMVELARLAPQIDLSSIDSRVIKKPLVYGYKREDGAAVQLPKWELIYQVVADMFAAPLVSPTPVPTPMPTQPAQPAATPTLDLIQIEQRQRLADEGARIAVQNGTSEANFAAQVAAILMEQGYQVVEFGDADRLDYSNTVIVDYTAKTYTLERLVEIFQVTPENVRHSPNLRSQVDIRIIVGQDFLLSVP